MDVQLEGRSVQDLANDAENISHCHTCRPRHTTHLYDHDENLTIPLSHLGEIEIRRYAQLSIERKTNFLELSAIDLICKDELPHHLHHYMPSLGFNFTLQSSSRKNRKKWFCRAIMGVSYKRFEKKQVKQCEVLDWIKLYSTARFPMLKQVKCIATVNRFLTKMLLNNYEVTEYLNFPDPILLSIEENSIISDHHAKSLRMHRCFSSCSTDCLRKRDKLRVELHLIVPHEGVTAKINFQRIYRITVNGCYWENPSLMRMELAACDLIKNENFPKQLITTLEQMGFCYSIRLDKNGDTKNDVWLIRGLYAVHQDPLRNDEVQSIELVEAMQMYESTIFTKLRKVCYFTHPHLIILFYVACPYVMMSIMDRADISPHYNLVSSSELHTIYFNKMERERAFPIRLDRHSELCKTCFRSKYHELLQTEFTMRFFMPSLDIDAPMTRIAIISSDYFERKEGSLELVYLDLIRVENILIHSVPYLPLLGFCCKIILHHDSGRRIEHVYARLLESKREMLADLNNNTINIILGSIKMYYANFFDIFRTVKCHSKFERVVRYGLPSCKHTFAAIHNSNLEYPLENIPSYYESQHPVIDGKHCYTCNKTIGEPELKMCRRLIIRLPSISLDNEMRRYFHLYSLVDDEDEDDELLDLEVLDFLEADSICSQQIPALNALGFCCELWTIDAATDCEMKWLVRGLYGKSCKSELGSFLDYTECLDDMNMYEGRGIGDLTQVHCPQTVIFYIERFGFDDMIVKRSSLMILEGGEKYVVPKHRK